jgi:arsenite oxidase small subunit
MRRRTFLRTCAAAAFAATPALAVAADAVPRLYTRARLVDENGRAVKASAVPKHTNLVFHYPYESTPCFLLNLGQPLEPAAGLRTADALTYRWPGGVGPERNIVAYSAICAHRLSYPTRQVSFIRYQEEVPPGKRRRVIHCCSEHSEYDPARGAAVLGGPAQQPLAAILLEYDEAADELYATGMLGGAMLDDFFSKYEFRLGMEFGGKAREPVGDRCVVMELARYCRQQIRC